MKIPTDFKNSQLKCYHFYFQLRLKKHQITQEIEKEEKTLAQQREKDVLRTRTLELLPDGEANIVKLEQLVEAGAQRLVALAAQWEKHRVPLINQYRQAVKVHSSRMVSTRIKSNWSNKV